jgi:hypothetical protein
LILAPRRCRWPHRTWAARSLGANPLPSPSSPKGRYALQYGGASVSDVKRLRELEADNAKLKRMYADLALENAAIKVS